MKIDNNIFRNFKSYSQFKLNTPVDNTDNLPKPKSKKISVKPLIGSTLGVASALLVSSKLPKTEKTLNEVGHMLLMAGAANVGGVLGGSINTTAEQKQKKWKEAGFQVMNISIPMLMVSGALEICKRTKGLNNNISKMIGSVIGMTSGAFVATKITNLTRAEGEPYRKYTIKDAVSNFDDIVATIKIGFKDILKYVPVDKILPFIYIYSGMRSGEKE